MKKKKYKLKDISTPWKWQYRGYVIVLIFGDINDYDLAFDRYIIQDEVVVDDEENTIERLQDALSIIDLMEDKDWDYDRALQYVLYAEDIGAEEE